MSLHYHYVFLEIYIKLIVIVFENYINPYPANVENMASSYQC